MISVSTIDQLKPLSSGKLVLCCISLSRSEDGFSIGSLVEEIYVCLSDERGSNFIDKLKEAGYHQQDKAIYSSKYIVDRVTTGVVSEEMDTFHRGKLKNENPALKWAKYRLDSSLLGLDEISLEKSLASILK